MKEQPDFSLNPETIEAPTAVDYVNFVESHEFGEYKKAALDFAKLLNSPDLKVSGGSYEIADKATKRLRVFDGLCFICTRAGVEVPALEEDLYLPFVPKDPDSNEVKSKADQVKNLKEFVGVQTENADEEVKKQVDALTDFLYMFSEKFDPKSNYGGIPTSSVIALLNQKLVSAGLNPVRPDYAKMELKIGLTEKGPENPTKVLIVDDDFSEVINTYMRLAGWPNLEIEYHLHVRVYAKNTEGEKERKLQAISESIHSRQPNVILMDQGLDFCFEGSDVISALSRDSSFDDVKFVANTGGEDTKLRAAGAYPNFEKGRSVEGFKSALL